MKLTNAKLAVFSDTDKLLKRKLCGSGENLLSERTRYATGACGLARFMGSFGALHPDLLGRAAHAGFLR